MGKDQNQSAQEGKCKPKRPIGRRRAGTGWPRKPGSIKGATLTCTRHRSPDTQKREEGIIAEEAQPDAPRVICQWISWKGYRRKTIPVHPLRPAHDQNKRAMANRSDTDSTYLALTCRRPARKTIRLETDIIKGDRPRPWDSLRTATVAPERARERTTGRTRKVLRKRLEGRVLTGCAR